MTHPQCPLQTPDLRRIAQPTLFLRADAVHPDDSARVIRKERSSARSPMDFCGYCDYGKRHHNAVALLKNVRDRAVIALGLKRQGLCTVWRSVQHVVGEGVSDTLSATVGHCP